MTIRSKLGSLLWVAGLSAMLMAGTWSANATAQEAVSYEEDVFPIIEFRCLACHQPGGIGHEQSGLDLTSYDGLMKGTRHGPIVVPGRAAESNLIAVIDRRTDSKIWMPHNAKRLSKCERLILRFWVNQGAKNN